jgi:hypothetical protein
LGSAGEPLEVQALVAIGTVQGARKSGKKHVKYVNERFLSTIPIGVSREVIAA